MLIGPVSILLTREYLFTKLLTPEDPAETELDHNNVEDNQVLLTEIKEDLLLQNDNADAVSEKVADIILGVCGQILALEKIKPWLSTFVISKNSTLFIPTFWDHFNLR